MPTTAEKPDRLIDTSVAIPLVTEDHPSHKATLEAVRGSALGLAGHAAFETFSVLTRLPAPARRSPKSAAHLIGANFPYRGFLSDSAAEEVFNSLVERGISGGAVYDALVGAAAIEHGRILVSRDRRALETYRLVGVEIEFLGD